MNTTLQCPKVEWTSAKTILDRSSENVVFCRDGCVHHHDNYWLKKEDLQCLRRQPLEVQKVKYGDFWITTLTRLGPDQLQGIFLAGMTLNPTGQCLQTVPLCLTGTPLSPLFPNSRESGAISFCRYRRQELALPSLASEQSVLDWAFCIDIEGQQLVLQF